MPKDMPLLEELELEWLSVLLEFCAAARFISFLALMFIFFPVTLLPTIFTSVLLAVIFTLLWH
jgi:hypothetical protein